MKVKELARYLDECDPEDEVWIDVDVDIPDEHLYINVETQIVSISKNYNAAYIYGVTYVCG